MITLRRSHATAIAGATALGLAAAINTAYADDGNRSSTLLDRISITGDPDRIQEIPGSAQRLDRDELDKHSYSDPHRILRAVPGVNIREEEGFGLFPNIGMRGTRIERNNRITTMEDGVLTAPAPYAAPAAYFFPPMGRMDSVEVRKGSSSIKYGPYTTGGAINMLSTPIPDEEVAGKAQTMLGSNGGQRTHAHVGGSDEQFGWLIEGYQDGSDGFKNLDTPEGGPNMADADTGYDRRSLMGKLRWNTAADNPTYQQIDLKMGSTDMRANETYLGLTLDDFRDDPYRRYAGSQQDRINTEREQYSLRHYIALNDQMDLTTTAYYTEFVRNWYKLDSVDGTGISAILADPNGNASEFSWITGDNDDNLLGTVKANNREYYSRGIQSQFGYLFNTGDWQHDLEVGARFHQDEIDRKQWEDDYDMVNRSMAFDSGGEPGSESNRVAEADAIALYVQDTITYGDLTLVPGLRYEDITIERTDYRDGNNPSRSDVTGTSKANYQVLIPGIGATYQLTPELSALAGIHKGFAPAGAGDDAEEEESVNFEAGFRYNRGALRSEMIGFLNQYENLVATCTAASGSGCVDGESFNGGEVDVYGVEALALYDVGAAMDLGYQLPISAAYTYTQSEFKEGGDYDYGPWGDVAKGDRLPQLPEHQLTLSAGVIYGPLAANVAANYVSSARATAGSGSPARDDKLDSRLLLDVATEYELSNNVSVFGSVENVTDEEYVAGWRPAGARPGQPRTFWAGLKASF